MCCHLRGDYLRGDFREAEEPRAVCAADLELRLGLLPIEVANPSAAPE